MDEIRQSKATKQWGFQIQPRLTTRAGFEIRSGININPSFSEEDAEFLKKEEL